VIIRIRQRMLHLVGRQLRVRLPRRHLLSMDGDSIALVLFVLLDM
jgi:hypothetical protein